MNEQKIAVTSVIIFAAIVMTFNFVYLHRDFDLEDDSVIEEIVEALIEKELSITIDLTPESKEEESQ